MVEDFNEVREKYLKMAKSVGTDAAMSAIHNDMTELEQQVFDGGFDQKKFNHVQKLRELSQEIWTAKFELNKNSSSHQP